MTKQQRLVLVVSILASFVAFLDGAIVNVALPAIQRDLGGGLSAQQWVVDAYLLTLGSLILVAGSLSDLLGRRRILGLGLWGFGIASVLCTVAPSSTSLIVFRGLQGIAGALLVPSSLAMIISTFSGAKQGKAIGSWTAWTGIAFVLGPLVGGLLVDNASWRWIFAINVLPIAVTLLLLKGVKVANGKKSKASVDFTGAVICALGLGAAVYALIEQQRFGWADPRIYLPLAAGIVLFLAFLLYENRLKQPMLPLGIFKNHNFSVGNVSTLAVYAGLSAGMFLQIVFLQQVAGYSALGAGMAGVPVTIILFLLSPKMGELSAKYGPRLFMGLGPVIAGIGELLLLRLDESVSYLTDYFPAIFVFGLGLVITVAPLTSTILGDVPKKQAGIASAVNNAVARIAGLLAVAAVGAVVAAQFSSSVDSLNQGYFTPKDTEIIKQSTLQTKPDISDKALLTDSVIGKDILDDASVSAFHTGVGTIAGMLIAGGVVSLIGIRNPAKKAAKG